MPSNLYTYSGSDNTLTGKYLCICCVTVERNEIMVNYNSDVCSIHVYKKSEKRKKFTRNLYFKQSPKEFGLLFTFIARVSTCDQLTALVIFQFQVINMREIAQIINTNHING